MISVEIRANAMKIEEVHIQRITNVRIQRPKPDEVSTYRVTDSQVETTVDHRYGDGAIELTIRALQALREEKEGH